MKIAFTSCTRYEAYPDQPNWNKIAEENPDYLFLLGDNIYMDYGVALLSKDPVWPRQDLPIYDFEETMERKYQNQFQKVPEFASLVKTMKEKNGFFGIWDDHDFAWNNAKGKIMGPTYKEVTTKLFHKYMDCSTNLPHVYYKVDSPLARFIFLDVRSYADKRGDNADLLGEEQFQFLEESLNHDLPFTIISSGIMLKFHGESWTDYPKEIKRLCHTIKTSGKKVLFLARDIHKNSFVPPFYHNKLKIDFPAQLVSSGMYINYLGIPVGGWKRRNWAILELEENDACIRFYNRKGLDTSLSNSASNWLQNSFI